MGLCDELITRPEESYQLWCVVVCDLETSRIGAPYIYIYIYNISSLRVNYRLSRVCRIVENALGLLVSVFRILRKPLIAKPSTAEDITLACEYLRNCLRRNSAAKQLRSPPGTLDLENTDDGTVIEVEWRREIRNDGGMVKLAKTPRKHGNELRKLNSGGTSTHHQEHIQLYLQHLVFVKPLLLPAAIAAGSSNGVTNSRCCRYSCMRS